VFVQALQQQFTFFSRLLDTVLGDLSYVTVWCICSSFCFKDVHSDVTEVFIFWQTDQMVDVYVSVVT